MSYRNPQQVVDRQSGQYYRQLQKDISSNLNNVIARNDRRDAVEKKEAAAREAAEQKELRRKTKDNYDFIKNAYKKTQTLAQDLQSTSKTNGTFFSEINRSKDILDRNMAITSKQYQTTEEVSELANLNNLAGDISDGTALLASHFENYTKVIKDTGKQGGFAPWGNSPNGTKIGSFFTNANTSESIERYINTNSKGKNGNEISFDFIGGDGEKQNITVFQLKQLQQNKGELIPTVPKMTETFTQEVNESQMYNLDKNGEIDLSNMKKEFLSETDTYDIEKNGFTITYAYPAKDKVMNRLNLDNSEISEEVMGRNKQVNWLNFLRHQPGSEYSSSEKNEIATAENREPNDDRGIKIKKPGTDLTDEEMKELIYRNSEFQMNNHIPRKGVEIGRVKTPSNSGDDNNPPSPKPLTASQEIKNIFTNVQVAAAEAGLGPNASMDPATSVVTLDGRDINLNTLEGQVFLARKVILASGKTTANKKRYDNVVKEIKERFKTWSAPKKIPKPNEISSAYENLLSIDPLAP